MTTLKPLPPLASRTRSRPHDRRISLGWLAGSVLCFGLLLFFLADPGRITRLTARGAPAHGVTGERPARVVPQGESPHDLQSGAPGLSHDEPRLLAGETGKMEIIVNHAPSAFPARESASQVTAGPSKRDGALKIMRITPEVVMSPRYTLANGPDKAFVPGTWIQVEVEFRAAADLPRETTFRYAIELEGKVHVGEVTHGPIFAGERLFSVAYLRPQALALFLRYGSFRLEALRNVRIDALSGGRLLDSTALRPDVIDTQSAIQGFVVDSSSTPFAPLLGGRHEPLAR